jgi:copper(I)-binding protein
MKLIVPFILALMLASCAEPAGPPILVSNVVVTAVARDMPMAAAYFDISNRSGAGIHITRVTSPNYESVEIHQTTIDNGIARMRKLDGVEIPSNETVRFERGSLHLMLMRPVDDAETITLNFYEQELLIVSVSTVFALPAE